MLNKIQMIPNPNPSQILSYHNKPYINTKLIYSAFRWCINLNFKKLTYDWFCAQGSQFSRLTRLSSVLINASNSCSPSLLLCMGPKVDPAQPTVPVETGRWTLRSSRIRFCSPPALHSAATYRNSRAMQNCSLEADISLSYLISKDLK